MKPSELFTILSVVVMSSAAVAGLVLYLDQRQHTDLTTLSTNLRQDMTDAKRSIDKLRDDISAVRERAAKLEGQEKRLTQAVADSEQRLSTEIGSTEVQLLAHISTVGARLNEVAEGTASLAGTLRSNWRPFDWREQIIVDGGPQPPDANFPTRTEPKLPPS